MYLTFKEALTRISDGKEYKNDAYHRTRIRGLIKSGDLEEAEPDSVFVRDCDGNYHDLGQIRTEPMVTVESVEQYIAERESERDERGCITKGGKPIRATFTDGTHSDFQNMEDVCSFFSLTRYRLRNAIKENRAIEYPVTKSRADKLGVDPDPELTEYVKFKFI